MSKTDATIEPTAVELSDPESAQSMGDSSEIYNESAVESLDSVHDGRERQILVNNQTIENADDLLVDTVTYDPGVSCPVHYHEETQHFFYVLEGEGAINIEGEESELTQGTIAWIGEGDRHQLYAKEDQDGMTVFEFFSNGECETVYPSGNACTWSPESAESTQ